MPETAGKSLEDIERFWLSKVKTKINNNMNFKKLEQQYRTNF